MIGTISRVFADRRRGWAYAGAAVCTGSWGSIQLGSTEGGTGGDRSDSRGSKALPGVETGSDSWDAGDQPPSIDEGPADDDGVGGAQASGAAGSGLS